MSTKKNIYDIEQSNQGVIHLYAEGMFYRAYEQSAFLLCELVHPFKVSCHFVKTIGDYICSVGFPQTSIEKWSSGREVLNNVEGADICLKVNEAAILDGFEEWKQALSREIQNSSDPAPFPSLQVYGDAYSLCVDVCQLCANLDRNYKYSLVEQL